uniref:SHSP domain-containing protein n=2 Tax=Populus alba TaxID=43335 RepID=A0A4V6AC40_POPAL|nr:hypothetical protein D5086_0000019770 [Populus alba]
MLTNKIRSRFNTGYNIPKNCNLSQMKSEFYGGILTIRIPRIIPAVQRTGLRELEAETSLEGPKPRDTATGQPESGKKGSKRLLQGDPSPEKKRKGKLLKRQRIGIS